MKRLLRASNELSFQVKRYLQEAAVDEVTAKEGYVSQIDYSWPIEVTATLTVNEELSQLYNQDQAKCLEAIKFVLFNDPVGMELWENLKDKAITACENNYNTTDYIAFSLGVAGERTDTQDGDIGFLEPEIDKLIMQGVRDFYNTVSVQQAFYPEQATINGTTMTLPLVSPTHAQAWDMMDKVYDQIKALIERKKQEW